MKGNRNRHSVFNGWFNYFWCSQCNNVIIKLHHFIDNYHYALYCLSHGADDVEKRKCRSNINPIIIRDCIRTRVTKMMVDCRSIVGMYYCEF